MSKQVSSSIIGGNKVVSKIDHIGIAVNNLEESIKFYEEALGLKLHGTETVEEQKVRVAFLPIGDTEIELLEATSPDSPIAKFIEAKGQGVQHLAFKVDNIEAALEESTKNTTKGKYHKIQHGAKILAIINPKVVRDKASYCDRFFGSVSNLLNKGI